MEELTLIPTRCSTLQNVEASNIKIVVHKNKKKGVKMKPLHMDQLKDNEAEKKEMDMKKVRYEVFKFGMSGFKSDKKEEVKVALAFKLGAKPPKNKYYNYKEYKHMKEKQLKEQSEQRKLLAVGKTKTGKPSTKGKRKFVSKKRDKNKDGILDPYGKPVKVHGSALHGNWCTACHKAYTNFADESVCLMADNIWNEEKFSPLGK